MPFTKKELNAIGQLFPTTDANRHDLVVRRGGTAFQREVLVEGKIRLKWKADGTSHPVPLPAGSYKLYFFIRGKKPTNTYSFSMVSPHQEPLGADRVGPLLVESYDRTVTIP